MAGFNISDKTHDEVEEMAYDLRTDMKTVVEQMWQFVSKRKEEFDGNNHKCIGFKFSRLSNAMHKK
jgi:hypothetical protein